MKFLKKEIKNLKAYSLKKISKIGNQPATLIKKKSKGTHYKCSASKRRIIKDPIDI